MKSGPDNVLIVGYAATILDIPGGWPGRGLVLPRNRGRRAVVACDIPSVLRRRRRGGRSVQTDGNRLNSNHGALDAGTWPVFLWTDASTGASASSSGDNLGEAGDIDPNRDEPSSRTSEGHRLAQSQASVTL